MSEEKDAHWTMDFRVPIALVMAIAVQSGAMIWWGATMQADVNASTEANIRQDNRINELYGVVQSQLIQSARTETELIAIRQSVERQAQDTQRILNLITNGRSGP